MSYNPNIPQPTDIISQSQAQILDNFSVSDTAFAIDHTAFSVASNQGKHKKSTYVEQGADPATVASEVAVYSKDTGTQPDLFYRPESNGTAVRLTGGGLTAAAWCVFDGTAASPIAPGAAYNVTNITNVANTYTINFTRAFASANYAVVILPSLNTSSALAFQVTQAAGSCSFVLRHNGVIQGAGNNVSVVCFGTLA